MNKKTANNIANDMKKAMIDIENKYGVTFDTHGGSFSNLKFDLKVSFVKSGGEETLFKENARIMGINPDIYGKKINYEGIAFTIKEINTRAKSYPVIAEKDSDGTKSKFRVSFIEELLLT